MLRSAHITLLGATIVVVLMIIGCEGDDNPVAPDPPGSGTIVINPSPGFLTTPWILVGPENSSGNADTTLAKMPVGEYTLTWGTLPGQTSPPSSTQALVSDDTTTFSCLYVETSWPKAEFALIPPETMSLPISFTMGDTLGTNSEEPQYVILTDRFHMAETEVTNRQFMEVLQWALDQDFVTASTASIQDALDGSTSELMDLDNEYCQIRFTDGAFHTFFPNRPVVKVSWFGAAAYCDWLSLREDLPRAYDHGTWSCNNENPYSAEGYRLPTEAEWELACRADSTSFFNTGDCLDAGADANYHGDYPDAECPTGQYLGRTSDVGTYPANCWGLFDMHGNVWEWCNDRFGTYDISVTNPVGVDSVSSSTRVFRGGRWGAAAFYCRSAYRADYDPGFTFQGGGFRPVRSSY
ncbi:MAG: formylglycine-generating enzyme family protein [Gemmatimonadales bacterium]|nr:formylglycine-generating enzyme family protein [Gemmatimonadales bacterium]